MYNGNYLTEIIIKERQRQLIAEADRSLMIKSIKLTRTDNMNCTICSITNFIKGLGASLLKKDEPSICGCRQGN